MTSQQTRAHVAPASSFASATYHLDAGLAESAASAEPAALARLGALLREYEHRHLHHGGEGYFVLAGLGHLDEAAARRFSLEAARLLGPVLPQGFDGELLREVRYRGVTLEGGSGARYSDTRQGGNLHTDGMHRPGPVPTYFTLFCVRQAVTGGDLVLVHIRALLALLADRPDTMRVLAEPVHFDTRDTTPGRPCTVPRPILDLEAEPPRVHYLREYVESGHRRPGVTALRADQLQALDELDALLDRPELQTHGRLLAGEMAFIDNRSVIHGRTPFATDPAGRSQRLLLRTWIGPA